MVKYKDAQGRFLTQGLFFERCVFDELFGAEWVPPFTLKEYDHEHKGRKYKSLRQIYLSYEDPTEYQFAVDTLGSWDHWLKLQDSPWFKPYLESWRTELDIKLRSKGVKSLLIAAASGEKGIQAAKWLAEGSWKEQRKAGRPSKAEVEREKKIQAGIKEEVSDDAKRLGLLN